MFGDTDITTPDTSNFILSFANLDGSNSSLIFGENRTSGTSMAGFYGWVKVNGVQTNFTQSIVSVTVEKTSLLDSGNIIEIQGSSSIA
jgi:hypothetical protein